MESEDGEEEGEDGREEACRRRLAWGRWLGGDEAGPVSSAFLEVVQARTGLQVYEIWTCGVPVYSRRG